MNLDIGFNIAPVGGKFAPEAFFQCPMDFIDHQHPVKMRFAKKGARNSECVRQYIELRHEK
ncbi:MAG: hypothetical protein LBI59_03545 [Candidatus Accumulibacter sp.]|nr:hypothetical protein [Accumulibacter sp.]